MVVHVFRIVSSGLMILCSDLAFLIEHGEHFAFDFNWKIPDFLIWLPLWNT